MGVNRRSKIAATRIEITETVEDFAPAVARK
jgi:hypothetical protein